MSYTHLPLRNFIGLVMLILGLVACGPDDLRTPEEILELKTDFDKDGFCAHEETCDNSLKKPGDCDNHDENIHPGAPEGQTRDDGLWGDNKDNDCDGKVDEGTVNIDNDSDGFCKAVSCLNGKKPGDCNDADPSIFPGAQESWQSQAGDIMGLGIDNNCDGIVDDAMPTHDDDGDGFCEGQSCVPESIKPGDCNDSNVNVFPTALEGERIGNILTADGLDNDCDGKIDEGASVIGRDKDQDGWCDQLPCTESGVQGDCNDSDPSVHPTAAEGESRADGETVLLFADRVDNDCDGRVDEGTEDGDTDKDGYAKTAGDCDDLNPLVFPTAQEWKDLLDNNCDGTTDGEHELADITLTTTPQASEAIRALFEVYPRDLFETRKNTWSFDHTIDIATVDWQENVLLLHRGHDRTDERYEPGQWSIEKIQGPYIVVKHASEKDSLTQIDLLNMDVRTRPIRLSLVMPQTPRPGMLIKSGWPIDGMTQRPGLSEHWLTNSPQGIASITLAQDPKQTTLFFWRCRNVECTGKFDYLGQYRLGEKFPDNLDTGPLTLEIDTIQTFDLEGCRKSYDDMRNKLAASPASIEELFRPVEVSCTKLKGEYKLTFSLIFTR